MRLVSMNCPNCNARLEADMDRMQAFCPYCGNALLIDDEVQRTEVSISENSGYNFEKGRQRARLEAEMEARRQAEARAREEEARMRRAYEESLRLAEEARQQQLQEDRVALSKRKCSAGLKKGIISTVIATIAVIICAAVRAPDDALPIAFLALIPVVPFSLVAVIHSIRGAVIKNGASTGLKVASLIFAPMGPFLCTSTLIVAMIADSLG